MSDIRAPELYRMAGIDPKTKKPTRLANSGNIKEEIKKTLRIIDEQDHVNRYKWHNLPCSLSSQELERLVYYRGQLCFFYFEELDEFYFMPYALDGTIDFYGRFNRIHPVPFALGTTENDKKISKNQKDLLSSLKLKVIYEVLDEDEVGEEEFFNSCVLLHDYTKQLSQNIIPRVNLVEPILDIEAECIPFLNTALLIATGIKGLGVDVEANAANAIDAAAKVREAALSGLPYVPIIKGTMDLQELNNGKVGAASEYMLAMQSVDNYRLSTLGLSNGGLFEKKAHELESENGMNEAKTDRVFNDGLSIRQHFCNIVNSIWDLGIWVEDASMSEEEIYHDYDDLEEKEEIEDVDNNQE